MTFTHLEVHSHFTLLGATPSVAELAARAAADGLTHLALTDTNALYAAVAFSRACHEAGVQPIIGMTVTVGPNPPGPPSLSGKGGASLPSPVRGGAGGEVLPSPGRGGVEGEVLPSPGRGGVGGAVLPSPARGGAGGEVGKLVLLATGPSGYRSLCRLSSLIQGSPERETVAARGIGWEELQAHREGLICLSGGRDGWIERYLRAGDLAAAQLYAGRLAGIFDEDACLALEIHERDDEAVAAAVADLARRLGLATVAVQPVYCLAPEDAPRLQLLAAIRQNARLDNVSLRPERRSQSGPNGLTDKSYHWLSPAEIAARFNRFPAAVAMAGEIAARCGPALPDGRPIWPALKLPAGQTAAVSLATLAEAGLQEKYGPNPPPAVRSRLAHELAAIAEHDYTPLFLVVADIVRFARRAGIPVSTRGSVANSLVAYCAGITTVDPIAHDLIFERFLNPARSSPPDIDLDLCSIRRDEVLAYVRETYGPEHVALVGTVSTLQPQGAVREVGKTCGLTEAQIGQITPLLPHHWHPDPRRREKRSLADVLSGLNDPLLREVVTAAWDLIGQPDHLSVHPGGVIITPGPLTDIVPVQWAPKGFLITQFEHGDVEAIGLPKIDLLGIRALTVLASSTELVQRDCAPAFRLEEIPPDDLLTGDLLECGETIGVFQCESEGSQRTLRKLRCRTVTDLAIANAFFKPGPATGGMANAFVRRYRGEEAVTYLHPVLAPILGPTKGVIIFQEQILRIATEIAGLSWAQADRLRRGMSHFGVDEMAALREDFIRGCQRPPAEGPGLTAGQAQTLWEQVIPFAGYGFNQGHATAYADVSYRSAYLKAHWPAAFLCARLANWGGFHHPAIYMAEAVRLGIAVRPPHVNFSDEAFSLTFGESAGQRAEQAPLPAPPATLRPTLWMGLGAVRDLRHNAIRAIISERTRQPFAGVRDLLSRVDLHPKEITHLIQCGALDGLGVSRAALLAEVEEIQRGSRRASAGAALQMAFDFGRPGVAAEMPAGRLAWERHLIGQPTSVHPLDLVAGRLPVRLPLRRLPESGGKPVTTAGVCLPGWTGGPGFFLGDGDTFVTVKSAGKAPPAWQPLLVRGRWIGDGWGTFWLQAAEINLISEQ